MTDATSAAREYLRRGLQPIPLAPGKKNPTIPGWPEHRIATEEEIEGLFLPDSNIGVILGEASGHLVDLDLDCPEAVSLASLFLPPTEASFGRESKGRAHWLYRAEGVKTIRFQAPDGQVLVEARGGGGQTMFPPSVHPSGETVTWFSEGDPAEIAGGELIRKAKELAACALLARHWPEEGSRQDASMALAGALLREGRQTGQVSAWLQGIAEAVGDEDVRQRLSVVEPTAKKIENAEAVTGWPKLSEVVGKEVVSLCQKWLGTDRTDRPGASSDSESKLIQQILALVDGDDVELFHTPGGIDSEGYAMVRAKQGWETWPVDSTGFRRWLRRRCREGLGEVPGSTTLDLAVANIEGIAQDDGPEFDVFVRVAPAGGNVYLDLADDRRRVVEIRPAENGQPVWEVKDSYDVPVRFRRMGGLRGLPTPVRGGHLEEFRRFLNVEDRDWPLLAGFLAMLLNPWGDYPILAVDGEHGSAKSTGCLLTRSLVDPNRAPLRSLSKGEQDLILAANNGWVVTLENVSDLRPWMSDALCRLATGAGFATRTFYQQKEETIIQVCRPVLLNGINSVLTRDDLASRAISITLPRIPDEERRNKQEVLREFEQAHPRILGALLDGASIALARRGKVEIQEKPRLADFCTWAVGAETALGLEPGQFMAAYQARLESMTEDVIESSVIGPHLLRLLEAQESALQETATSLLEKLEETVLPEDRGKTWPKSAQALGNEVRRLAPALRKIGVHVEPPKRGDNPRHYTLGPVDRSSAHKRGKRGSAGTAPGDTQKGDFGPRYGGDVPREERGERGMPREQDPAEGVEKADSRASALSAATRTTSGQRELDWGSL